MEKTTIFYKKCLGCGIVLQDQNSKKLGYVQDTTKDLCFRCFQIKNYNKVIHYELNEKDFLNNLEKDYNKNYHYFYILDAYDFFGSRNNKIEQLIKYNKITIIINKFDLLNKLINQAKLINFLSKSLDKVFKKNSYNLMLISAWKNIGIDELYEHIGLIKDKKIFVIGASSTGKSSILNALLKRNKAVKTELTISPNYVTTLSNIELEINEKLVIDTPGIKNDKNIFNYINNKEQYSIFFNKVKKIKPITFQLFNKQYLLYENLAVFEYLSGEKTSFHLYVNDQINLHRGKIENLLSYQEKVASFEKINLEQTVEKKSYQWTLNKGEYTIFISGLGWISFSIKTSITIRIKTAVNVKITLTNKLI